jgi:hypothetical protein
MKQKIYLQSFVSMKNFARTTTILLSVLFSLTTLAIAQSDAGVQIPGTGNTIPQDPEAVWEMFKDDLGGDQRNTTDFPSVWNTPVNTGVAHIFHTIVESNPRVNETPLEYGDWIGGFYLDDDSIRRCGGARMWTGTYTINLALFGNDGSVPQKNGFYGGELVEFRAKSFFRVLT